MTDLIYIHITENPTNRCTSNVCTIDRAIRALERVWRFVLFISVLNITLKKKRRYYNAAGIVFLRMAQQYVFSPQQNAAEQLLRHSDL